ncbi:NUDIX hydrolase [Angustibacter luteus]|uniref:NUDIX hydrolase n=1 Tax=Angustibacter luteus TaxID=658456 RepID=A0ABW1JHP5_9ACTN
MSVSVIDRRAARLLCIDPSGAVLLQSVVDPAVPDVLRYVSPGGGIDPGESAHDAACREAWEELGLTLDDLGEPVEVMSNEFGFDGQRYLGHNTFYALRTERFEPVPRGMDDVERGFTRGVAWWTPDQLDALLADGADVAPSAMAGWVRDVHHRLPVQPVRPTARVLVVDRQDRALLMRAHNARHAFWFPPGGGVDPGESTLDAARRELREELGLDVGPSALGDCVWRRRHVLPVEDGGLDVRERWFLLRVEGIDVDRSGWTDLEVATIEDVRWWTVDEILAEHSDVFAPRALGALLPQLLADERAGLLDGRPPVDVGP